MNPSPTSAPHHTSALVLFSGGQDSTTCLAWALQHFAHVETIGFDSWESRQERGILRRLAQVPVRFIQPAG